MAEYIERGKAIAMKFTDGIDEDGVIYVPWRDVVAHLKSLPAADVVENVRGKWKYESCAVSLVPVAMTAKCSKCGIKRNRLVGDVWNYCSNCGADMRGDNNG